MNVACSPDWNFPSRADPFELADVVVVVLEAAGLVVVVVVVVELEHAAATRAITVTAARLATMRRGLELVESLIMWILPLSGHPRPPSRPRRYDSHRGTAANVPKPQHTDGAWSRRAAGVETSSQATKYLAFG
jgi:hypothetical protein